MDMVDVLVSKYAPPPPPPPPHPSTLTNDIGHTAALSAHQSEQSLEPIKKNKNKKIINIKNNQQTYMH
jgi:hypothetical protein